MSESLGTKVLNVLPSEKVPNTWSPWMVTWATSPFLDGSKELAVSGLEAGLLWLVKHIEKKNHHQTDYQPEGQVFIKWTQLESLPTNSFNATGS